MALLSAIMFLSPIHVFGLESDLWKSEGIRYPNEGQLVPAGPIEIEWNTLDNNVEKYNIYLDEKLIDSVIASDNEIMKSEIYTTEVSSHQVQVGGVLNDGSEIKTNGIFVFVGTLPNSKIVEGLVDTQNGFVVTDEKMNTSLPGLFAVGDVRNTSFRQVVTATGDGAKAAHSADEYIQENNI